MPTPTDEILPIRTSDDVVRVRQEVRKRTAAVALSIVDQTKFVTAASELARNTLEYGGGGTALVHTIVEGARRGVRVTFEDHGPGIPDIELALKDGYTSGGGLGLGLGGTKRLADDFHIDSRPGEGTAVAITKWKI
jgi:serine/threonine-protein kinase RsbT